MFIRYDIFEKWIKTDLEDKERHLIDQFVKMYAKLLYFKWDMGLPGWKTSISLGVLRRNY